MTSEICFTLTFNASKRKLTIQKHFVTATHVTPEALLETEQSLPLFSK